MAFKDFPEQAQGIELLQRSLKRGRLGHAYLFVGEKLDELEAMAKNLAKVLNCQNPVRLDGVAVDCCDECLQCQKINHDNHGDVFWVRPESLSRMIRIGQITFRKNESPPRVLEDVIYLRPVESEFKIAVIVSADRLNENAANAFLKTLEEPPAKSVLILLTTEPQQVLETILSRCLRLNFAGEGKARFDAEQMEWLGKFTTMAAVEQKSLLGRYRLMDVLLQKLAALKSRVEETQTASSPLEKYPDAEKELRDKWEEELKASVASEYRRQRGELLLLMQWWLRDVWLKALEAKGQSSQSKVDDLLNFPELAETESVARRISPERARQNLQVLEETQRLLSRTNVSEPLALEVGLLKLQL